ncbi:hypothetical protein B0H19DRAFT_1228216 [Mycena capillaripes]|nr:hypothetical protein B0H19DRAFT_1228216 [Mycena capillaripes]
MAEGVPHGNLGAFPSDIHRYDGQTSVEQINLLRRTTATQRAHWSCCPRDAARHAGASHPTRRDPSRVDTPKRMRGLRAIAPRPAKLSHPRGQPRHGGGPNWRNKSLVNPGTRSYQFKSASKVTSKRLPVTIKPGDCAKVVGGELENT